MVSTDWDNAAQADEALRMVDSLIGGDGGSCGSGGGDGAAEVRGQGGGAAAAGGHRGQRGAEGAAGRAGRVIARRGCGLLTNGLQSRAVFCALENTVLYDSRSTIETVMNFLSRRVARSTTRLAGWSWGTTQI